ncbi:MAG TPA: GntR family transcriptional regulator [Candidatus Angelobacter sp.]|jgi:DNA-binding GntR family transcriptional regulator|nr:GntR family transcriptional regulator [Candidatus Angelobacter sp.]
MTTRRRTTAGPARQDLADLAYTRLAEAIATCEIPAGAPLNEREVAARLGMSRTPLRAALHRLALEGMVTTVPKRGSTIAPLDPRDVEDNMAVREALEVEMARHLIAAGAEPDPAALEELLARQRHAVEHLDSPAFLRADEQFHLQLLAAAGNRAALDAAQRAWLHVNRARYTVPMTVNHMRAALRGHREIAAAVAERSAPRAERAIRAHLEEPLRRQLRYLAEHRAPEPPQAVPPVLAAAAHLGGLVRP